MKPFSVEELLETARARAGSSDFGPADFLEGLTVLVGGLNDEAGIREDRSDALNERLLRLLVNRLRFARDLAEHPEIADEDVGSPVIIESLPRTGSTKLHRLLGASGDFQTVPFWQANMFARIPGLADGGEAERIRETREYKQWMYQVSPAMLTGHPMFTDEPEEDQWLGEATFRHPLVFGLFESPRYGQWLMQTDHAPAFDYLLVQIRYLQWQLKAGAGKPWLLKSPTHLGAESELSRIYHQPRLVVTHRDPAKCIASITSAAMAVRQLYSDRDSSASFGVDATGMFAHAAAQHMAWRDAHPDAAVLDLAFHEINTDGIAAARRVYDFLGMTMSQRAEAAMHAWEARNPRDKHAPAQYSAEAIGTTDSAIRQAFAAYIERFAAWL